VHIRVLPLLCMLFVSPLLAQSTDLQIVLTTDKTAVKTGERFHATIRVKNAGPNIASQVNILLQPTAYLLDTNVPSGWICTNQILNCHGENLAAGAEIEIVVALLAPNNHAFMGSTLRLSASVQGNAGQEIDHENNNAEASLQLSNSGTIADLGAWFPERAVRLEESEPATLELKVVNFGVDTVDDVLLVVQSTNIPPFGAQIEGPGWSCAGFPGRTECRTGRLSPMAAAPLTMSLLGPAHVTQMGFSAYISALGNLDPRSDNDLGLTSVTFASADSWRRMLLPLASQDVPGANGALWRTKTTMLIADTNPAFELSPHPCEHVIFHCVGGLTLGAPFDPAQTGLLLDPRGQMNGGSQFFYVRTENASKLRMNSRVYDVTRESDTAGSEIPIPRDDDFSDAPFSLLGIPVRAQSRYTLRVYDYDALDGARVAIKVYADDESTPRAIFEGTLRIAHRQVTTLAALPERPAYLQIDPAQLASLDGADMMRIDVEPLTPGIKLWAFVSVTDNDTHHVTTFSAQ